MLTRFLTDPCSFVATVELSVGLKKSKASYGANKTSQTLRPRNLVAKTRLQKHPRWRSAYFLLQKFLVD